MYTIRVSKPFFLANPLKLNRVHPIQNPAFIHLINSRNYKVHNSNDDQNRINKDSKSWSEIAEEATELAKYSTQFTFIFT